MFSRRQLLRSSGLSLLGASASGWLPRLAAASERRAGRRHCVLLWMNGGPSQTDTFDLKPGHENGGPFKEIATSAPGLRFSEHLPKLARHADCLAVLRGLSSAEGDHGRGTYLMRTGHSPTGAVRYPSVGASLSKELGSDGVSGGGADDLPGYVAISPYRTFNRDAYGPGFLGPRHAPLTVAATDGYQAQPATQPGPGQFAQLQVDDLAAIEGVDADRAAARLELWESLERSFLSSHAAEGPLAHRTLYERATRMMRSRAAEAFELEREPDAVREAYGRGRFGQGCLLARRLIERGVPFIEVSLGAFGGGSVGWDTHQNNFDAVKQLSAELDAGWATLISELKDRDLLDATTFVWMGEFGRTPKINGNQGRDHYNQAWTCVLGGGGIAGGQAFGKTSADGTQVEEDKVGPGDVLATVCRAVGVDPDHQNTNPLGRPFRIAEGKPIESVLA